MSSETVIRSVTDTKEVAYLFENWDETLVWSCLQGVMGEIYAAYNPVLEKPVSAMAMIGDFTFFAGKADRKMVLYKPVECKKDFMIMVPQNEAWAELIEKSYPHNQKKVTRYAIKKEQDVFDKEKLERFVADLSAEYEMKLIDEPLYHKCKAEGWCRDLVSGYKNYEMYQSLGLGVVILHKGEIVAGASSYTSYNGGIEIEIDTREDYRRRGLATVSGARLILECLERGLYPSWDAQNKWSVALAEKLGYHYSHDYVAYEITNY